MKLKDFVLSCVLRGSNQRLPTTLLGTTGITNFVNFALNDIYTFEGKFWTFMYDSIEFDTTINFTQTDDVVYIDVPYPILRIQYIEDISSGTSWYQTFNGSSVIQWGQETFECLNIKPTSKIDRGMVYFKPHTKRIYLKNNSGKYIIHYLHYFDDLVYDDTTEIPIPNAFLWALYSLVMWYIYPNYWQMGDNEEQNAWNKSKDQLQNLAKTDSLQITWVSWSNIK